MPGKAKMMEIDQNYEEVFRNYEDEQLKDVLKKRKLYQDEAARAAISEAINRQLINSEDDLHAPEYRHEPLRTRLFPLIESSRNKNKIRRSISRGFLLAGILPTIWGMVRLNAGFPAEGFAVIAYGIGWMGLSAALIRRFSLVVIRILSFLMAVSVVYTIRWMILSVTIVFMDIFIIVVLFSLMVYGLLFLLRMNE